MQQLIKAGVAGRRLVCSQRSSIAYIQELWMRVCKKSVSEEPTRACLGKKIKNCIWRVLTPLYQVRSFPPDSSSPVLEPEGSETLTNGVRDAVEGEENPRVPSLSWAFRPETDLDREGGKTLLGCKFQIRILHYKRLAILMPVFYLSWVVITKLYLYICIHVCMYVHDIHAHIHT